VQNSAPDLGTAFVVGVLLLLAGCATAAHQERSDRGTVTVGVTASGPGVAAMTFRVTVDPAGLSGSVRADVGVFTKSNVAPGDHVVRLLDVPARCRVDDGAERTITLSQQRRSAVVRFHVVCT
jgi:hypothetical protein